MRAAALLLAAVAAGPACAEALVPVEGEVIRLYARDARSDHLYVERQAQVGGWVELRADSGATYVAYADARSVAPGDRVRVRDAALQAPEPGRIGVARYVVTDVLARHASVAPPAMQVEVRGERVFIVAAPTQTQRVAAAD